jgi:hypothetical protein
MCRRLIPTPPAGRPDVKLTSSQPDGWCNLPSLMYKPYDTSMNLLQSYIKVDRDRKRSRHQCPVFLWVHKIDLRTVVSTRDLISAVNLRPRLHTLTSNARITLGTNLAISILAMFFPRQLYLPLPNVNKMFFVFPAFSSSLSYLSGRNMSTSLPMIRSVMQDQTVNANIGSGGDVLAADGEAWR